MRPVIDADRAGGEPARHPGTAARPEPGKPDPRPAPLPGPAGRPLLQAAGQRVQPRVVSLLGVLCPPRRQLILVPVPPAPQRRQCLRHLGQLLFGNTVGTFGCALVQAPPDMRQALVERLARRPAVRGQHARLRRRRVQRKPLRPQHHLSRRAHAGARIVPGHPGIHHDAGSNTAHSRHLHQARARRGLPRRDRQLPIPPPAPRRLTMHTLARRPLPKHHSIH